MLDSLDLSGNRIADLWGLAAAVALKSAYLHGNPFADLYPLEGLPL